MYMSRLYVLHRATKQENRTKEQFQFQLKQITFVYIGDNKALFDELFLQKNAIEQEIGFAFE